MSLVESALGMFGLQITSSAPKQKLSGELSVGFDDEGSTTTLNSTALAGSFGTYLDQDGQIKTEVEAIRKYREMSLFAEVDVAIQEIVNESIPQEQDTKMLKLNLDSLDELPSSAKTKIQSEFDKTLKLLNYDEHAADYFKKWYVDGRIAFQVIVDKDHINQGIQKLILLDVQNLKKMKDVTTKITPTGAKVIDKVEEYFLYSETGFGVAKSPSGSSTAPTLGLKISRDAIIFCTSGLSDNSNGMIISHLNKAIRPINQLRMLEDATVVYFIARAPERRVFYVDVGNLPKLKAEQYLKDIMNRYRNKIVYDARTGDVKNDKKYMSMLEDFWMPRRDGCFSLSTKIKLLDGRDVELGQIIVEHKAGKENWVYSVSPTGKIVPGKISWAGVTRTDTEVLDVYLDNGEIITATPDHKFILRNGEKIEAQYLQSGSSLMPLYTKKESLYDNKDCEYVLDNETGKWITTHSMSSNFINGERYKHEVIHHVNFDRFDNTPTNLLRMKKQEHLDLHSGASLSWRTDEKVEVWKDKLSISGKEFFNTDTGILRREEISKFNNECAAVWKGLQLGRDIIKAKKFEDKLKSINLNEIVTLIGNRLNPLIKNSEIIDILHEIYPTMTLKKFRRILKFNGYNTVSDFMVRNFEELSPRRTFNAEIKKSDVMNHKVLKIVRRIDNMDVGTLTIDEHHEYHDYHNFALSSGIFVMNSKGTQIESLPGAQNITGYLDSLTWFKEKMYESLNIPKSRLQQENGFSMGQSTSISRDEVTFQKFIDRLRNKFSQLILDTLSTQLSLTGIVNKDEWDEIKPYIKLDFQKDNYFSELKNQEIWNTRFTMVQQIDSALQKYVSKEWVQRNVLKMNDDDIALMKKQIDGEKNDMSCWPDWKLQGAVQQEQQMDIMQHQQDVLPPDPSAKTSK